MTRLIVLDSSPLALLTFAQGDPSAAGCDRWLQSLLAAGHRVIVPEIADYEVRRELMRLRKWAGLRRLDALISLAGIRYEPISTAAMRLAAEQWARSRQQGRPTAAPQELDCDVIVAAQARHAAGNADFVVATSNVRHLTLFVPAADWQAITP